MSGPDDTSKLEQFGWGPRWAALAAEGVERGLTPGIILRHDGSAVLAATPTGRQHIPVVPSNPAFAVGDRILIGTGTVDEVLHRSSLLQRRDPSTGTGQFIAANADVVAIVCGLDRPLRPGRIERFSTLAWDAGASPLVVCTKCDLGGDDETADFVLRAESAAPGITVVAVSAQTGAGLDDLRAELAGKTAVFVGESGAGKSTLLNSLYDHDIARTGSTRTGDSKGRHTTTARQLFAVGDFWVIDTPGVREVGLWAGTDAVDTAFDDIANLGSECRFGDCTHDTEPGCAVAAAIANGTLAPERLNSWQRLRREALAAELRADPVAARRANRQFGRMIREVQRIKGQR